MKQFNVIQFDFTHRKIIHYDVLPYFREEWEDKYHKEEKNKIKETKSKELLRQWIISRSSYRFRARCEYEYLVTSWPFGSYEIKKDLKKLLTPNFDIEKLDNSIKFYNILMQDMEKIDIHDQIMMNIDIITDILYDEFKLDNMNNNILSILEGVAEYLNDNYGPDECHPKGVIIYPYADKVVFTCWDCGAIVYVNGGIYYISEDDGYWCVEKSTFQISNTCTRECFGYKTGGTCISWAPDIADALIQLKEYVDKNGTPVYYEGIDPPRICHYIL